MGSKELSAKHRDNFNTVNARFGLAHDESTHGPIVATKGRPLVYSSDPFESDVPPRLVVVGSIAELNKMLGTPDDRDDSHVTYPKPGDASIQASLTSAKSKNEFRRSLTRETESDIRDAVHAWLGGNSSKVKDYENVINMLMFPMKIAVFADPGTKVIEGDVVIKGPDPVVWNYGQIIMDKDSSLTAHTAMSVTCNSFSGQPTAGLAADGDDGPELVLNFTVAPYIEPAQGGADGPNGTKGDPGDNAIAKQSTSKGCPWYCDTQPQNGHQGNPGKPGKPGSNGNPGVPQGIVNWTVNDEIVGNLKVTAGGGNGQDGGKGGKGGDGGPGGDPGSLTPHNVCTAAHTGPQGNGGDGGRGGNAGDGGDGAPVTIFYKKMSGVPSGVQTGGKPGQVGKGGDAGVGSTPGQPGDNGGLGKTGKPSNISFQQI